MGSRLLVLTAGFGEGHNAAARALAAAADARDGPGTARVADVFALARPRLNALSRRSYLSLINHAPGLWRAAYGWLDRAPRSARLFAILGRERRLLADLIRREQPESLCSTYPVYGFLLGGRVAGGAPRPPHYTVVTDSISINSLWWRVPCAAWFVPNPDSAEVLLRHGVPADRVRPLGFPVAPAFAAEGCRLAPPLLAAGGRPRVLLIINSGTRGAVETAHRLLARTDWEVTCTVGRNRALHAELTRAAAGRATPARILGWTEEIPRLLLTHHVVVSKAGGATTQEAIAAHCPMVVNQIVPGQEEGNYELLRRRGIGGLAETPDTVLALLDRAFANDGRIWLRWRGALAGLARPEAARHIVDVMLQPADRPVQPVLPG